LLNVSNLLELILSLAVLSITGNRGSPVCGGLSRLRFETRWELLGVVSGVLADSAVRVAELLLDLLQHL